MKKQQRYAYNALKKLGAPVFERSDEPDTFGMSSEMENSYEWIDYYGEFRGGYPWISPEAEEVLSKYGLFFEWENPGCVFAYEV